MTEKRAPIAGWLAATLVVASLLSDPVTASEIPTTGSRIEWLPCWFTPPDGRRADCARLHVPQDRSRADTIEVVLPLVIYRSASRPHQPDPVVVLGGGGPGNAVGIAAEQANDWWYFLDALALDGGRDVIVLDQRGAGLAEPSLTCEWDDYDAAGELAGAVSIKTYLRSMERGLTRCRRRLLAAGVDLAAYDSHAAAADMEDLRHVLGLAKVNLYGTSYAARIALGMLRNHPQGVRSAILDSAVTPEARFYEESPLVLERGFEMLFAACDADALCAAYYPDTRTAFGRVMRRLRKRPLTLTMAWPDTLAPFQMRVDDERLVEILFQALYSNSTSARLPLIIRALDRGSSDLLVPLARDLLKQYLGGGWSDGLYYAAMCREELPFNDMDASLRAADGQPLFAGFNHRWLLGERAACALWQVTPADADVDQPVLSDTPVLVLAGGLDPVTPPAWGEQAAARLPMSWFKEFPAVGHDVIGNDDCALRVAAAFLARPRSDPRRLDCVARPAQVYFDLDL